MQAYADYKDSGVEWLGEVPKSWGTAKLKFIASLYNGDSLNESQKKSYETDDTTVGYAYISSKDISAETSSIAYKNGLRIPKEHTKFKIAPKTASLICIEGGSAGRKIAFTRENVCFVNKLACVETKQCHDPRYTFHLLKSGPFQNQFYSAMTGLIGGVAISNIKNIELVVPPLPEQTAIANFLDDKTAKIDELVGIKRRQIQLLAERKQILIQNAVTKGLNPDVPMNDSGIDWIGSIPAHWKTIRFKNLFSQSRLPVRKSDEVVTSFRDGQVTLRSNRRLHGYTEAILEGGYQGIRKGQLTLNSMDAFEGAIGVSESDGKCTPEYVICNPKKGDTNQYYFAFLLREMALAKYIQVICNAVRQRAVRIRFNNLAPRFIAVPPLNEQSEIIKFIEVEREKIGAAIAVKQNQIIKLNEYKTTLINAAVTGKIKVA